VHFKMNITFFKIKISIKASEMPNLTFKLHNIPVHSNFKNNRVKLIIVNDIVKDSIPVVFKELNIGNFKRRVYVTCMCVCSKRSLVWVTWIRRREHVRTHKHVNNVGRALNEHYLSCFFRLKVSIFCQLY